MNYDIGDYDNKNLLFSTSCGSVSLLAYNKRVRILYGNLVIDQTYREFYTFLKMINGLYKYIVDIRQIYYKRFLIKMQEYSMSLALNSNEVKEMYELLGGAKVMLELQSIIEDSIKTDKNNDGK